MVRLRGSGAQLQARGMAHEATYYRTGAGAEVDLVVEGSFGSIAFEIKHSSTLNGRELRRLRDFVSGQRAPLGVVINNDATPRLLEEKLVSLPLTHL